MKLKILIYLTLSIATATTAFAQMAGDLDTSFGVDGRAINSLHERAAGNAVISSVIATDGTFYQFGSVSLNGESKCGIISLTADGVLNTKFADNGRLICDLPTNPYSSRFSNGVIQPDGKLVALGTESYVGSPNYFHNALAVRFLHTGELDTSFGVNGVVTVDILPEAYYNYFTSGYVTKEGKIILAGVLESAWGVTRLNADGSLDTSFGDNGYKRFLIGQLADLRDMAVDDGNIYLAGAGNAAGSNYNLTDFVVAKLDSNGNFDTSFASTGIKVFDVSPETDWDAEILETIKLTAEGDILVAGRSGVQSEIDSAVVKLKPNGDFDLTFGDTGVKWLDYAERHNIIYDLAVQDDGKIVCASFVNIGNRGDFLTERLLPDGKYDDSFGKNGQVVTDVGGNERPYSVQLWNGKIIVTGYAMGADGIIRKFGAVRLWQNSFVSLRGRLVNLLGRGIPDGEVTIVLDKEGIPLQTVPTDSQGFFNFSGLESNGNYVIYPTATRCIFSANSFPVNSPWNSELLIKANCFRVIK